jgi:hypothetical protein
MASNDQSKTTLTGTRFVRVVALAVAAAGIAATISGCGGDGDGASNAVGKLNAHAAEYAAASGAPSGAEPHLTGRIVPVDVDKGRVDQDVYVALPSQLRARSPEDVSTVVLIKPGKNVVGHYGSEQGQEAIQETAGLTIVDLRSGQQYVGTTVLGPLPPASKTGPQSASGGKPNPDDIAKYLAGLQRVPAPPQ